MWGGLSAIMEWRADQVATFFAPLEEENRRLDGLLAEREKPILQALEKEMFSQEEADQKLEGIRKAIEEQRPSADPSAFTCHLLRLIYNAGLI